MTYKDIIEPIDINAEAFASIIRSLEEKQSRNKIKTSQIRKKIYEDIPELGEIDQKVIDLSIDFYSNKNKYDKPLSELIAPYSAQKKELLANSSFGENALDGYCDCKKCHDKGFIEHFDKEGNVISTEKCTCLLDAMANYRLLANSRGLSIPEASFESFDLNVFSDKTSGADDLRGLVAGMDKSLSPRAYMKEVAADFKYYVQNFDVNNTSEEASFLLFGPVGTGKSFLLRCIEKALLKRYIDTIYVTAPTLFEMKRPNDSNALIDRPYNDFSQVFTCKVLIIDDLGTEKPTDFTVSTFNEIIDDRISSGLPTIISTNFSFENVNNIYGERVASRINEKFDFINIYGRDLRKL